MTKFVETRKNTSGSTYYVFNPKKYIREALDVGYQRFDTREEALSHSDRICQQYEDYKARRHGLKRVAEDSVDGLIAYYRGTHEWKKLTHNSAKFYDLMIRTASQLRLGQASTPFGEMIYKRVSTGHADRLYSQLREDYSDHRAVHVLKVLRKIWYVGKRHGMVTSNPFERMGVSGLDSRVVLWEPEQVDRFMQKADDMGFSSIGTLALLCYDLCQRPSDMRMLRWSDLKQGVFRFNQQKTGTEVEIPASDRLLQRLEAHRNEQDHIVVCETTSRPYDRRLYNKWVSRIRQAAGLPNDLQLRDLRRTGATEMAEAGCTEDELRSVTGHQSRDVLSIYVRPTVRLAASGVNKRFANRSA
jgi:integrase